MLNFTKLNSKRIYNSLVNTYDVNKSINFRDLDYIVENSLDLELNQKFINSYNSGECFSFLDLADLRVEFKLINIK